MSTLPAAGSASPSAPAGVIVSGHDQRAERRRRLAFIPAVRRIIEQIEPYAAHWEAQNHAELNREGPLWVAMGDSATQGIGASAPELGWVGVLRRELRSAGHDHRLVNLSVSGARVADLLRDQLPHFERLVAEHGAPQLVTVNIGGNDQFRSPRVGRLRAGLRELLPQLPAGTVVALLTVAVVSPVGRTTNTLIRELAAEHGLVVADLNRHYHFPYRRRTASDWFHPNDRGHAEWARAFAEALGTPASQRAALSSP